MTKQLYTVTTKRDATTEYVTTHNNYTQSYAQSCPVLPPTDTALSAPRIPPVDYFYHTFLTL